MSNQDKNIDLDNLDDILESKYKCLSVQTL